MDFSFIKLPSGVEMRNLYEGEDKYFKQNPNVSGMATEDGKVILNPYSLLKPEEYQAVAVNESARLLMRSDPTLEPKFELTEQQVRMLDTSTYRNASDADRKATIAARMLSGDPSAGVATSEQTVFLQSLKDKFNK